MKDTPLSLPVDLPHLFPEVFDPEQPRPLKRDIHRDLRQALKAARGRPPSGPKLRRTLAIWCERPEYLRALVAGVARVGLDGQPCGEIVKAREAREAARDLAHPLSLIALYPEVFDPTRPMPLKIGIQNDLIAEGHDPAAVRRALWRYTQNPLYRRARKPGMARVDLRGQPAGLVEEDRDNLPIPLEDTVPGRLELTLKFNELPKARPVKDGYKIGIHTGNVMVVTTLRPRSWRKLEQAKANWPQWGATLTGRMGEQAQGPDGLVLLLNEPVLQVFEKKPRVKAEAAPTPTPEAAPDAA